MEIHGPRGVGKTYGLQWLYSKLLSDGVAVEYIDMLAETEFERELLRGKVVLVDNGHKATLNSSKSLYYAKRVIAAFSPLGLVNTDQTHSKKYTVGSNPHSLYFIPFTIDETREMVLNTFPDIDESVIQEIIKVSWRNPRYIDCCISQYNLLFLLPILPLLHPPLLMVLPIPSLVKSLFI